MDDTATRSKVCFKCGEAKLLSDFYTHKRMADGHLNKCKACTKRDVKKRYEAKPDEIRAYEKSRARLPHRVEARKEYAKTDAGREAHRRALVASKERHPERYKARQAVGNAVRDGRLIPQACEVCGDTSVQAHHTDYSKPLDVQWLCFRHHREDHGHIVGEDGGNAPCFSAN